ncbi:MAG: hypothetical protein K0S55_973 [Clostridia bacterium]|nr:hypothetical protein [Clostridia bacterium]
MPRKMDYYEKLTTFNNNNLNNEKAILIYKKMCREDGYIKIPITPDGITSPFSNNYYESPFLNNFKNKITKDHYKKTILNKLKIIIRKLCRSLCTQKSDIISNSSILSGALSFGINLFFIFGIIAAAERGYNGGIGGELFLTLGGIYIMFKILKYADKKDRSKT